MYNSIVHLGCKFILLLVVLLGSKQSDYCINLGVSFYEKRSIDSLPKGTLIPRAVFAKRKLYSFENNSFYGVEDYDQYLTSCYSKDYMIPKITHKHIVDSGKVVF